MNSSDVLLIEGVSFQHVCKLEPERNPNGSYMEYLPQGRYKGAGTVRLNPHGQGPFCKFKVPRNLPFSGVYAVVVSNKIVYIGECVNLSVRWGSTQYGAISPKNCYVGGQSTNCKINSRVLLGAREGRAMALWFHKTSDHKALEAALLSKLSPPWNGSARL